MLNLVAAFHQYLRPVGSLYSVQPEGVRPSCEAAGACRLELAIALRLITRRRGLAAREATSPCFFAVGASQVLHANQKTSRLLSNPNQM